MKVKLEIKMDSEKDLKRLTDVINHLEKDIKGHLLGDVLLQVDIIH